MNQIPLSEAHFLDWLEPHMEQRMVPPEKPRLRVISGAPVDKMSTDDLLALRSTLVKYDPGQPRDDHGRFADAGAHDPTVLDAGGKPWRDAAGEHSPGWGPRGKLNDRGEEVLYNRKNKERYAVPRGYNDVMNPSWTGKGWDHSGQGIAYTRPSKGEQRFEVRHNGGYAGERFEMRTDVVTSRATSPGSHIHNVESDGQLIGSVRSMGGNRWKVSVEGEAPDPYNSGKLSLEQRSKPEAVMYLTDRAVTKGLIKAASPDLTKYSPDQPRDDHGRFSDGGGSGSVSDVRQIVKPGGSWDGKDYVGGSYTPEREALHDRIIGDILAGGTPVAQPVVTMLGGGPASGKSSIIRSGLLEVPAGTVTINPDDVKTALPEFKQMLAEGGKEAEHASTFVHEESSEVSKMALREAAAGNISVIYDATGDNSLASIQTKVDGFRNSGYTVNADYVTCGTDEAWSRAVARAADPQGDGRSVPEDYLRETHASLSVTVPQAIEGRVWDNFRLWDTSGNDFSTPPTLVASYADKGEFVVHDSVAWAAFRAKATP